MLNDFVLMLKAEKGLAKNSVEAYERDLRDYLWHFKDQGFDAIKQEEVEDYLCGLKATHSNRSIARKLSAIKQFYLFLIRSKKVSKNPVESITTPKIGNALPKILSKEDVERLLDVASKEKSKKTHTILEILYATGMRISELVSLKKNAISYYEGHPIVLVKGKGGKERLVPINKAAYESLKEYQETLKDTIWLFPSYGKMGHITRQRFAQILKKLAIKANIDPDKVSPHVIRHAFATHMLQNGADLVLIKELLGHKNLSTSEIYLHVLPEDLKELVQQYHPLSSSDFWEISEEDESEDSESLSSSSFG